MILGQTVTKIHPARNRRPRRAAGHGAHDGLEMVVVKLELGRATKRESHRVLGVAGVVLGRKVQKHRVPAVERLGRGGGAGHADERAVRVARPRALEVHGRLARVAGLAEEHVVARPEAAADPADVVGPRDLEAVVVRVEVVFGEGGRLGCIGGVAC